MKIKEFLSQSANAIDQPWLFVVLNTAISALILGIFEPFHFRLNNFGQLCVLWVFAAIACAVSVVGFVIVPKIFKRFYDPEQWTVGKTLLHCISILIAIGVACFIYEHYYLMNIGFMTDFGTGSFYQVLFIDLLAALTIGIIPISFGLFTVENNALKRNLDEARMLNRVLADRNKPEEEATAAITLSGDTKESVKVLPEKIVYMEASGNYVDICYTEKEREKHKLLRSTIKQMEETVEAYPFLVRCHRAYIVNMNQIRNVNGNAQGYRLNLMDAEQEIPVSRTYMRVFKSFLS